ncbi:MAG: C_GCAxxG_C_C family protein [Acidaminococcaceae bacterium]|nr:C_GCAxxG_C_C family protein [Acidaminococcaceae bacterium]
MEETKIYTEEEIEQLAEKASQNAMEHFKHGLNCGECVLQGFLDLGISEYPPEIIALVSGMGGGMGFTKHTCGAVNAGMVVIGSKQGRKNPYAKETFEERVDELHHDETGIYPRHAVYVKDVIKE